MAQRPSKFKKLVSIARSEERRFGAIAGESQAHVGKQTEKLQDLTSYRQSYSTRPMPPGAIAARHWHDYHRFLQKLDLAIDAQRQIVCDSERNLKLHRERWMQKRQKRKSLQHMQEKNDERERLARERLEQKQQDEISNASYSRRAKVP